MNKITDSLKDLTFICTILIDQLCFTYKFNSEQSKASLIAVKLQRKYTSNQKRK